MERGHRAEGALECGAMAPLFRSECNRNKAVPYTNFYRDGENAGSGWRLCGDLSPLCGDVPLAGIPAACCRFQSDWARVLQ